MESSTRTPPEIVASSEDPPKALAAFIAQELEAWGFRVSELDNYPSTVAVGAGDWQGVIKVRGVS